MAQLVSLESFDRPAVEDKVPDAGYQEGYEEGYAAGLEAANTQAASLNEECVQALSAIDFTYAEARRKTLDELAPLLNQIAHKILPHCVATGFADQIASLLIDAIEHSVAEAVTLHVHPSQQAAISEATQNKGANVIIQADPDLSEHAAWVKHAGTEAQLDMDALLNAITDILGAINDPENRTDADG